jgi:hypothetical protein
MDYIGKPKSGKKLRFSSTDPPQVPPTTDTPISARLPDVYRRLWGGVAKRSKKVKELTNAIENQRRLEWLKLLLSNNHLHLTDKKQLDLLKQLAIYEESIANLQTTGGLRGGISPKNRPTAPKNLPAKDFDMSRLVELFDDEQEAQFQRAIQKWRTIEQAKKKEGALVSQRGEGAAPLQ